jgi:hypothetical protein
VPNEPTSDPLSENTGSHPVVVVAAPAAAPPKGMYIPSWIGTALQGLLITAVVGGYGMFYSMHTDIAELKLKVSSLETDVISIETKLDEREKADDEIRDSLTAIKTELPFIKQGITDLKGLLIR